MHRHHFAAMPATVILTGTFDPRGPTARAIADLWWLMLWLGVAVFVLFGVVLAVGLCRKPPSDAAAPSIGRWLVGGGVVLPLVVISVVFAATLVAMRATPSVVPDDALVIDVVGHQFRYEVTYPDDGIRLTNELRLPVGRPVALRLTSADVIHSFWVPELGGKLDMLPDGINTLVLEADEPGEHVSRCAEFCGLEHAHMTMRVVVEPEDDFAAWQAAQR
jgi:cytochrome c oxidase subunit 2